MVHVEYALNFFKNDVLLDAAKNSVQTWLIDQTATQMKYLLAT